MRSQVTFKASSEFSKTRLKPGSRTINQGGEFMVRTANFGVVKLGPLPTAATDRPRIPEITWEQKFDCLLYSYQASEKQRRVKKVAK